MSLTQTVVTPVRKAMSVGWNGQILVHERQDPLKNGPDEGELRRHRNKYSLGHGPPNAAAHRPATRLQAFRLENILAMV